MISKTYTEAQVEEMIKQAVSLAVEQMPLKKIM